MTVFKITLDKLNEEGFFDLSTITSDVTEITVDDSVTSKLKGFTNKIREDSCLKSLYLRNCNQLTTLDLSNLPASLEGLYLQGSAIQSLTGNLPDGCKLEELCLHYCRQLTTLNLSDLPASLKKLDLYESEIQSLTGNLPDGCMLEALNLSRCRNLQITPELLSNLQRLEENQCVIHYPPHFILAGTELSHERFRAVVAKAKSLNPDLQTTQIERLFHRFLSEGIEDRGGVSEIISVINPVLTFLESNPLALELTNSISSSYLAACVNQPVNGMTEIAAFVEIAQKSTIPEKLQAAKRVAVQDALKELMVQLPPERKPGSHVEVEAGNALLREVHKKLLEEEKITQPWLGVPTKIACEGAIKTWLTEEIINEAYEKILPILSLDIFQLKDLMCETNHKESWAMVAFPQEYQTFKEELNTSTAERLEEAAAEEAGKIATEREEKLARFIKEKTEEKMPHLAREVENPSVSKFSQIAQKNPAIIF